ncbi:hypothetical protein LRD18_10490 [Halorhodospira halochloris]|uniref:hypothetical protein n=1 Tax=Halorhodospira halochloris TaxID=1052 RepID=UPI001EE8A80E|nr:hypothetical protein [Halorhodospira halochloris]MCG5531283.1 hypothetical protein [Halorhodospira halochloris]
MLQSKEEKLNTGAKTGSFQSAKLVSFGDLAECACKLTNTLYRRASDDPSFPEPVGAIRVAEGARRRMAFRADEVRAWIANEIERRQFDPAVLERFDRLLAEREAA